MLNINTILNNKVMEVLGGNKELTNKVMNTVFNTMYEQAKIAKQAIQVKDYKLTIYPVNSNKATNVNKNKVKNTTKNSIRRIAIIGPNDKALKECVSLQERMYNYVKNVIKHYGQAQFVTCPDINYMDLECIIAAACDRVNKENNKMIAKMINYIGIKDDKRHHSASVLTLKAHKPIYNAINCADEVILLANKNNMKEDHLAVKMAQVIEANVKKKGIKKLFQHINIGKDEKQSNDTNEVKKCKDNIVVSFITEEELDNIDTIFREKSIQDVEKGQYKNILKTYKGNSKKDLKYLIISYLFVCGGKKGKYSGATLGSFKRLINTANKKGVEEAVNELCTLGEINIEDIPAGQN